jgi:hypothetical protein
MISRRKAAFVFQRARLGSCTRKLTRKVGILGRENLRRNRRRKHTMFYRSVECSTDKMSQSGGGTWPLISGTAAGAVRRARRKRALRTAEGTDGTYKDVYAVHSATSLAERQRMKARNYSTWRCGVLVREDQLTLSGRRRNDISRYAVTASRRSFLLGRSQRDVWRRMTGREPLFFHPCEA